MLEYESFKRVNTEPHRSYYIPFDERDKVKTVYGIVDRKSSSKFISLDGEWNIKQHRNVKEVVLDEVLEKTIPVPSCVQMHGFDCIQYINVRYSLPVTLSHITNENPCWHYRRKFILDKKQGEKYYVNFTAIMKAMQKKIMIIITYAHKNRAVIITANIFA